MDNINALPDLVIRNILLHLVVETDLMYKYANEFKEDFYVIQVSSKWRRLGIPLVYKAAFVELTSSYEWTSNINLITKLDKGNFVKRIVISCEGQCCIFVGLLEPLYNILKLDNNDWPQGYGLQLSKKHQTRITELVQCLATRFPRVVSMNISIRPTHPFAREFTNQLVTMFFDRLVSLYLNVNTPVDVDFFLLHSDI